MSFNLQEKRVSASEAKWGAIEGTYAVRFLLPFGWRSPSAAGVEGSKLRFADESSEFVGSEVLVVVGELDCSLHSALEGGE